MSLKSTINTVESDVKGIYQYLSDRSYFLPENKNIQNIVPTLRGDFAPDISFAALKQALANGTAPTVFPISTEIPDTYFGMENPQIIGTYQTLVINSKRVAACGLVRKNAVGSRGSGSPLPGYYYSETEIFSWLNGDYLSRCSAELRAAVAPVSVPTKQNVSSAVTMVSGTMHLLSGIEVGMTLNPGEGQFWELWQQRTGLTSPSNSANPGRVVNAPGMTEPQRWWLRGVGATQSTAMAGGTSGDLAGILVGSDSDVAAVLPCCWILAE